MAPAGELGIGVGVTVRLFGRFTVTIDDTEVPPDKWRQRARHLVALLSLQPGTRLHREQVASTLWPHLNRHAALANLHKAAHLVRRATGDPQSVVLAGGMVGLWPDVAVEVDAVIFEADARRALEGTDSAARRRLVDQYGGGFLVEDPYEEWTQEPRIRFRALRERLVGPLPDTPTTDQGLIGRHVELAQLRAARGRAREGRPTTAVLRGPAGIGKTALLDSLIRDTRNAGWTVWHGHAAGDGEPYAPLREPVAHLFTDPSWERSPPRHAILGALTRAAAAEADRSGLLIAVDDADLLDTETGQLLRALSSVHGLAVLLCLAARRVRSGSPVDAVLAGSTSAAVITVAPLGTDDARQVVRRTSDAPMSDQQVDATVARAGGVPLLLEALAGRTAERTADDADPLAVIAAGLAGGDPALAADLQLLACAGTVAVVDMPRIVGSDTNADRVIATGALERRGAQFRWRNRLVREAVLATVPDHRRPALHGAVADRLEAAGGSATEIARHLLAADRGADAVPHLIHASDAASAMAAWPDALALVETALDHAPDDAALLARRAKLRFLTGDPGAAIAFGKAAAVADPHAVRDLRLGQAWAWLTVGDVDAAEQALAQIRVACRPATAREAIVRGMVACFAGRLDEGNELAESARALALRDGRPDEVIDAAFVSGMVAHARGDAPVHLRREILAAEGLGTLAGRVNDGYLCPAQMWLYSGEPVDEVASFAAQLRDAAHEVGARRGEAFALLLRGQALLMAGAYADAAADLSDARDLHDAIGAPAGETLALVQLGMLAVATRRAAHAAPLLAAAHDAARRSPLTTWHLLPRIHGAQIAAASDLDQAQERVDHGLAALRGPEDRCPACWPAFAIPATITCARAGANDLASQLLEKAAAVIDARWRRGGWVAALDEARAWTRHDTDPNAAAALLGAAAAEFDRSGQRHDAARCRAQAAAWQQHDTIEGT